MRIRLRELTLRGFRGFKEEQRLELLDGVNVIQGPVGSGKTSIIQAIEYALYGTQLEVKERISKMVDLINEESDFAYVKLALNNGIIITRELKRVGESARETPVLIEGNSVVKGREVDRRIIEVLGIDEDDFERFVLVTHRTLEALIYGSTTRRSLFIDKLFGLEILDNLTKSIPLSALEKLVEGYRQKLASIRELPEIITRYGSIENARERLEHLRRAIDELRKEEEGLSAYYEELLRKKEGLLKSLRGIEDVYREYVEVRIRRENIESELERLGARSISDVGVRIRVERLRDILVKRLEEFALVKEAEELERLVITRDNLPDALDRIYNAFKALLGLKDRLIEDKAYLERVKGDLELQVEALKGSIRELETRLSQLEPKAREYKSLIERYGDPSRIKAMIDELKLKLEDALAEEILRNLTRRILAKSEGPLKCPICGRELTKEEVEELRKKLEDAGRRGEAEELRRALAELERVLATLESIRPIAEEYENTRERLGELKAQLDALMGRLENVERSIRDLDRRIQLLSRFIDEFRSELDEVDRAVSYLKKVREFEELRKKEEELKKRLQETGIDVSALSKLEDELRYVSNKLLNIRARLNEASAELTHLEVTLSRLGLDREDPALLRRKLEALEALYNRLLRVKAGLKEIQAYIRDEMIRMVKNEVTSIFKALYPYGDLDGAGIEVVVKEGVVGVVSEYTLYGIRSSGRKVPVSRLSDGQRLTIAFAFIIGVFKSSRHNVDFILMDEPIPYVDENIRRSFSNLIARLVKEGLVGQVILTTQSEELLKDVINACKSLGVEIHVTRIIKEGTSRRLIREA